MIEEEQIIEIFCQYLGIDESLWHRQLTFEELSVAPRQLLELTVALEEQFDMELNEESLEDCETVGEALALVLDALEADQ